MNECPVSGCGALIQPGNLLCHRDWTRLPQWASEELLSLRYSEGESDLCLRTVAVVLAYLNDLAAAREQVAG